MTKNIKDFIDETINNSEKFDQNDLNCIKKVIRKTISFYGFKSYEEVEKTENGTVSLIHLDSIVEENLLTKVVEHATSDKEGSTIESVYEGKVIRNY